MAQLFRGAPWSTGISMCRLKTVLAEPEPQFAAVAVLVAFGSMMPRFSILDTGNSQTIIPKSLAQQLQMPLTPGSDKDHFYWHSGSAIPEFGRCPLTFVANQEGQDLTLQAEVRVVEGWTLPPLLGMRGYLEKIRFAIDPIVASTEDNQAGYFLFGEVGSGRRR